MSLEKTMEYFTKRVFNVRKYIYDVENICVTTV